MIPLTQEEWILECSLTCAYNVTSNFLYEVSDTNSDFVRTVYNDFD
jgi:hypothetical protein